jgi:hypothetical protein
VKHRLKTWPEFFSAVREGVKTFEVRKDDRGFNVGDTLELAEWEPTTEAFTGRVETRDVVYIVRGAAGAFLPEGLCVLGLELGTASKLDCAASALVDAPEAVVREVERRLRERARHDFVLQLDGMKQSNRRLEMSALDAKHQIDRLSARVRELEANEPPAPWAAEPKHNDQEAP